MADLLDKHAGNGWREDPSAPELWEKAAQIPVEELWEAMQNSRGDFVRFARAHVKAKQKAHRPYAGPVDAGKLLDPRILTIGFARRFATYKRATLLLSDRERLLRMLQSEEHPVQFVFSGKAHPRDEAGKRYIQDLIRFTRENGVEHRLLFLEDYDIAVAREMIHGVDVWLNNPRRPNEASGTSGMKVGPNLGLNCSILDGWWDEGFTPEAGWAIGDRRQSEDYAHQDWIDSQAMYSTLENEVIPKFYQRDSQGIPRQWMEMVQASLRILPPLFSTHRMVRDYAERAYVPAHLAFSALSGDGQARAKAALAWRDRITAEWSKIRILAVEDDAKASNSVGSKLKVSAAVDLRSLSAEDVQVQLLYGRVGMNRELHDLVIVEMAPQDSGQFVAEIEAEDAGHRGYIVRVRPHHPDVRTETELPLVAWQKA
jgi:starch phosphorylase